MKKLYSFSFSLFLCLCFFSTFAKADIYLSGGFGKNFNENTAIKSTQTFTYDNEAFYSGAVGYAFPLIPVRAEIEGLYSKEDSKTTSESMNIYSLLANGYVRIPLVGLYAGGGLGYASIDNKKTPVYQGMFGVEYGLLGANVALEYRHFESTKELSTFRGNPYEADIIMVKFRYEF